MATLPWYKDPVTQAYNPPVEPGVDIGTPFHTDITALLPGTVSGVTYGGYGARVDVMTAQGDVYYQHLDTVDVRPGQTILAGQDVGLSGGQLYGGNLPNSPLNSTGPHVEVGYGKGGNPYALIAAGPELQLNPFTAPVGIGGGPGSGSTPAAQTAAQAEQKSSSSSGGGLVNINFPDPFAGLIGFAQDTTSSVAQMIKDNVIPLVVAAIIVVIVLGSGPSQQSAPAPQLVPIPV